MTDAKFTATQAQAVADHGKDILVSASAGSGKTTVLVERVLQMILAPENPTHVKQLLIVTFTEAAASEMKEKIQKAIEGALNANPENEFLNQQLIEIQTANISTIHAFCHDVIRRFYYVLNLDPNFTMLTDDTQAELMKETALNNVFNKHFEMHDQKFLDFLENFTGDRDFEKARSIVLKLYYTAIAKPDFETWFGKASRLHAVPESGLINAPIFQELIISSVIEQFNDMDAAITNVILPEFEVLKDLEKTRDALVLFQQKLHSFTASLIDGTSFNDVRKLLYECQVKYPPKGRDWDDELIELHLNAKQVYLAAKDLVKETWFNYFAFPEEEITQELNLSSSYLDTLLTLEKEFMSEFAGLKRAKNLLDFSDLEQFAYQILNQTDTNSRMAQDFYQHKFREILVDEYQDTNPIQEQIIQSVKNPQENNMFMVGDVKQSIYAFRQAEPQLFLQKYQAFKDDNPANERIILADNFRSTNAITDFVNTLFNPLMTVNFGGIDYLNEGQLIFGAKYYPTDLPDAVEVALFDKNTSNVSNPTIDNETDDEATDNDDETAELDFNEIQMVIARIKQMQRDHFQVYDSKLQAKREVRPSDIAILTPTRSNNLNIMDEFAKAEIPLFISDAQNYFQTLELTMIMSYLKIIDNPDQDIPLVSVLRSPMYGFTEPELAQVRINDKKESYYNALQHFVTADVEESDSNLREKVRTFLTDLDEFRDFEKLHRISELIWQVYEKTRLVDLVTGLPNGRQRRINLQSLYERASSYESAGFKGLYQFITFISRMQKSKKDLAQPLLADAADDSVRLMTIHGSKGLEFPVVFLVGLSRQFNLKDLQTDYIIDSHLGIGLANKHEYVKKATVVKNALIMRSKQSLLEEQARVLYVALTRAQQKLILVCTPRDLEKTIEKYSTTSFDLNQKIAAKSFFDLIGPNLHLGDSIMKSPSELTVAMQETQKVIYLQYQEQDLKEDTLVVPTFAKEMVSANTASDQANIAKNTNLLEETAQKLFNFKYDFEPATKTTAYQAVSEIKQLFNDPDIVQLANAQVVKATNRYLQPIQAKPGFLTSKNYTAADIGTATHLIMQKHDFTRDATSAILDAEIAALIQSNLLEAELAEKIDLSGVLKFLQSEFAKEITTHSDTLEREVSFSTLIKASNLFKDYNDEASKILVHGTIDGYYQSEKGIVLFDYKTDHIKPGAAGLAELGEKYTGQLRLYQKALEEFTGINVAHKYLIALRTNELLEVH